MNPQSDDSGGATVPEGTVWRNVPVPEAIPVARREVMAVAADLIRGKWGDDATPERFERFMAECSARLKRAADPLVIAVRVPGPSVSEKECLATAMIEKLSTENALLRESVHALQAMLPALADDRDEALQELEALERLTDLAEQADALTDEELLAKEVAEGGKP